jgi:hypothetical protein
MLASILFLVVGVAHAEPEKTDLQKRMQQMSVVLQDLLSRAVSPSRFGSNESKKAVPSGLKQLGDLSHAIEPLFKASGNTDPSLSWISQRFQQEVQFAKSSYEQGHQEYSRTLVTHLGQSCVMCHSRSDANFANALSGSGKWTEELKPEERVSYYLSIRNKEAATKEIDQILENPKVLESRPLAWEKTLRLALAMDIRWSKSKDEAIARLAEAIKNPETNSKEKQQFTEWMSDLKDPAFAVVFAKAPTAKAVERLWKKMIKKSAGLKDPRRYVLALGLSRALHDQLSKTPAGKPANPRVLWELGQTYESAEDLGLFGFHEWYYLSCMEIARNSPQGRACYDSYSTSVILGFTGTAGEDVPDDLKERLRSLKALVNQPVGTKIPK